MRRKKDDDGLPQVAMDYAEVGDESGDREQARKILVGGARPPGAIFCHLVSCKGLDDELIVKKMINTMEDFGLTQTELKTDGEPALAQVQEAVIAQRPHATLPTNPPAHDP